MYVQQALSAGGRLSRLSNVSILAEIILSNEEEEEGDDRSAPYGSGGATIRVSNIANKSNNGHNRRRVRQVRIKTHKVMGIPFPENKIDDIFGFRTTDYTDHQVKFAHSAMTHDGPSSSLIRGHIVHKEASSPTPAPSLHFQVKIIKLHQILFHLLYMISSLNVKNQIIRSSL